MAGVVIGVAVVLALATFLVTYLLMRSRRNGEASRRRRSRGRGHDSNNPRTVQEGATDLEPEQSLPMKGPRSLESYLPQSADDKSVQTKVAILLEQVQLHVENFYHNSTGSVPETVAMELVKFDSPDLPEPLLAAMRRSQSQIPLITHCLTRSIVSSIMPDTDPERSLLPLDFVALPSTIRSYNSTKPGKASESSSYRPSCVRNAS